VLERSILLQEIDTLPPCYYGEVIDFVDYIKTKKAKKSFTLEKATEMAGEEYTITITFDGEAAVWYALNDDIPIALESDSLDLLIERVKLAVPELLELNGKNHENTLLHFTMERETILV